MSEDGRGGPDAGTTWDELSAIWEEVRDIVSAWEQSQPSASAWAKPPLGPEVL